MKFLFLKSLVPLLLFSFAAQAKKTETLFLDAAILKLKHAKQYTLAMASLMPEDKYSFKANHQTHHQGEIIVYLRLNGIKPPDYVGW